MNTMETLNIKQYLKKYPNATLAEFFDYQQTQRNIAVLEQEEHERKLSEWYNNVVGKYFLVKFNINTKIVFKLCREKGPRQLFYTDCAYKICNTNDFLMSCSKRFIEKSWLQNPFYNRNDPTVTTVELTEEQYNRYVENFKKMIELHNNCEVMLDEIENGVA